MADGASTRSVGIREVAQLDEGAAWSASASATWRPQRVPAAPLPTHDQPCVACGHGPHHFLDCECGCSLPLRPGLDTALDARA